MKDVNKIILVGRLGSDPVARETKSGISVVNFSVATSRKLKSEGTEEGAEVGTALEETQWHRIVAWGKQGEICSQYLRKGQPVYIEGSVRTRKFESKDGAERIAFEVHAESVSFLGRSSRTPELEAVVEVAASAVG